MEPGNPQHNIKNLNLTIQHDKPVSLDLSISLHRASEADEFLIVQIQLIRD